MLKEYFNDLLRNPPEISYKHIEKIINGQLGIKLGQITGE